MLEPHDRLRIRKLAKGGMSVEDIAEQEGLLRVQVQGVLGRSVVVKDAEDVNAALQGIDFAEDLNKYATPRIRDAVSGLISGAIVEGVPFQELVRVRLGRLLVMCMGGMIPERAAARLRIDLVAMCDAWPTLSELIDASVFVADGRNLAGLAKAQRSGDVKANLVHLERQTGDFTPATKNVSVASVDLRAAWAAVDGTFEEIVDGD